LVSLHNAYNKIYGISEIPHWKPGDLSMVGVVFHFLLIK